MAERSKDSRLDEPAKAPGCRWAVRQIYQGGAALLEHEAVLALTHAEEASQDL
jgi:hypothetical protein